MPFAKTPQKLLGQAYALEIRSKSAKGRARKKILAMRQEVLERYHHMTGSKP